MINCHNYIFTIENPKKLRKIFKKVKKISWASNFLLPQLPCQPQHAKCRPPHAKCRPLHAKCRPPHAHFGRDLVFAAKGGLEEPPGGNPPPLYMKKHHWLKVIFRPWGAKKNKKIDVENGLR